MEKEYTLYEIFEKVRNNEEVPYEQLKLAFLTYRDLLWFANHDVEEMYKNSDKSIWNKVRYENNVMRYKKALNIIPREWLGEDNIPGTSELIEQEALCDSIWESFNKWKRENIPEQN